MPFVRFSRDRRGYEHVYLVHTSAVRKGKPARSRVLYWYRSPPGVKVGREAFDEEVRRALEAQYPDLTFDWDTLAAPPPPVPVEEPWRERRRLQKARRARAAALEAETDAEAELTVDLASGEPPELLDTDVELLGEPAELGEDSGAGLDDAGEPSPVDEQSATGTEEGTAAGSPPARRGRRRRRGGRKRPGPSRPAGE